MGEIRQKQLEIDTEQPEMGQAEIEKPEMEHPEIEQPELEQVEMVQRYMTSTAAIRDIPPGSETNIRKR